ncbi:MAG: sensor histidine kinase [Kiritimatiellia bacterium]
MTTLVAVLTASVCVTGTVTFVSRDRALSGVLAPSDGRAAMWFAGENNGTVVATLRGADRLSPGDRVVVCGETSRLGFAPGLAAHTVTSLGRGSLGPAREVRLSDLDWGRLDNARVTLAGVLTEVQPGAPGCVRLTLATAEGAFAAEAPATAADWPTLIDARLRLTGVAMSMFNIRREFIGVMLEIVAAADVAVAAPAGDPFALPFSELDALLPYSPQGVDLHRRHVRGTVTYVRPGEFLWLQEGISTLKVRTPETTARPGDAVEAVGFVTRAHGLGQLTAATVRVTGHPGLPAPTPVGHTELSGYPVDALGKFLNYDGRYVKLRGRMLSCVEGLDETVLVLEHVGDAPDAVTRINVCCPSDGLGLTAADVAWRPTLEVAGVLELTEEEGLPAGQIPAIRGWTLRVDDVQKVSVVPDAAWRKHRRDIGWRRIVQAMAGMLVVLLGLGIAYLVRLRIDRRRLAILTAERKRMAADLHDTLEQHLAGARMVLNTAMTFSPDVPAGVKRAVSQADEILAHAKAEMRARIFDMRSDVLFTRGPERVFRDMAAKLNAAGAVTVRTRFRDLPETLPDAVFAELVFIVGEAITNAIKHGQCRNIVLASDPTETGFVLTVANDGRPFEPDRALGPEAGHYGLSGMRERAKRADIGLAFAPEGRWMTLRLTVRT